MALLIICLASIGCGTLFTDKYKTERYQAVHEATLNGEKDKMDAMLNTAPHLIATRDENDNTLLHLAVLRNEIAEAQDLLSRKADVNAINSAGMTPLHLAAKFDEMQMTKLLLSKKPNLSIRDKRGLTPLDWATKTHHSEIEALLRNSGASE